MKSMFLRLAISGVAVLVVNLAILVWILGDAPDPAWKPEGISVEVRDPETDPWLEEERKRIEEEAQKLQEEQAELARQRRELDEKIRRVQEIAKAVKPRESDLKLREESVARLEEELRKAREEADRRADLQVRREKELEAREEKTQVEREEFEKRQRELEKLASTLVEQQKRLAERTNSLENKETSIEEREREAREMARMLLDRQKEIEKKQQELAESQKTISESQTDRDREWERIKDEWKKLEAQRKAVEDKLASAKTTATEWEALKEEWRRLEAQRNKLEEAQKVRENVSEYRKQFDRQAYEGRLSGLKAGLARDKVESEFIPCDFYFETADLLKRHLGFFGMTDMFYNTSTRKFVMKRDYGSGGFDRSGSWDAATEAEVYGDFSRVGQAREGAFYTPYIDKAMARIGGPRNKIAVLGLMPVNMVYEIVLHQRRVMEVLGLSRASVKRFQFAPWFDKANGKWRFKVLWITVKNGSGTRTRKVGNYQF